MVVPCIPRSAALRWGPAFRATRKRVKSGGVVVHVTKLFEDFDLRDMAFA